jgi:hypothetical protein
VISIVALGFNLFLSWKFTQDRDLPPSSRAVNLIFLTLGLVVLQGGIVVGGCCMFGAGQLSFH